MSLFIRWLFAFALLALTYNPTRWNYVRWSSENYDRYLSVAVLLGLILIIGYIIYVRATLRSIGAFGMMLVMAVVASMLWVLYDFGLLDLGDISCMALRTARMIGPNRTLPVPKLAIELQKVARRIIDIAFGLKGCRRIRKGSAVPVAIDLHAAGIKAFFAAGELSFDKPDGRIAT